MSLFGFAAPVDIEIRLDGEHERNQVDVKLDNQAKDKLPVYYDGENVQGTVCIHRVSVANERRSSYSRAMGRRSSMTESRQSLSAA